MFKLINKLIIEKQQSENVNDARYLIASHCFALAVTSSNVSSYYVHVDLICEHISLLNSLLKSLSKSLLNSSLNDNSQQTLNLIRYLLLSL